MGLELSIIIITLNEETWLPRLLESIKQQNYKNYEIIIADYNSTDKTREIAKKFGCKITLGGNYSVGRNNGVKVSKGKYLLFLDADCLITEEFLKINLKEFKKSKAGVGTSRLKPISERYFDKIFFKLYDYWSYLMQYFSPHCAGCGIFSKREVFNKINGFDENIVFAENHDFVRRAKDFGFVILPVFMYTSVRRMDKEGRMKFVLKYLYSGLYRLFYKEIDKKLFKYGE